VLVSENMIAANDGVGAWAQKEKGHAAWVERLPEVLYGSADEM